MLMNFDISVITDRKATIRSIVVQELFENKFKNIDFLELLEEVIGKELITNKEVKENETNKLKNFYEEIIKESDEVYGKQWFIYAVSEKSKGYSIIKNHYNDKSESTNKLKLQLIYINNCLSNLLLNEFFKWGETLEISIRNILKIEYFVAKRSIIYIFENPAVFNEVQKRTIKDYVSLMCTSGQINLSI